MAVDSGCHFYYLKQDNSLPIMTQYHINTHWQCGRFSICLQEPKIMGIINATPDSFSDGGQYQAANAAIKHAESLVQAGADILDIGGESTRSGAQPVSPEEEWQRIEPILKEIHHWNIPITLDTRRTAIMQAALEKGWVDGINDVSGLEDDYAVSTLASYPHIGICLMHMKGLPENMQNQPHYHHVVSDIAQYLQHRVTACIQAGIAPNRITVDPGFGLGFGKPLEHNITLMHHLKHIEQHTACPLLIGISRKSIIGALTQETNPSKRVIGSVVGAIAAIEQGAKIIRVHDVLETKQGLQVWQALRPNLDKLQQQ